MWEQRSGGERAALGIHDNMSSEGARKYGFRLYRGGQYGKPKPRVEVSGPEFFKLDMDIQAAFAAMEGADGNVPSRGIQEIREHRQRPWRILARRFRECADAGVPLHIALGPIHCFELWVRDLYAVRSPDDLAA